MSTRAAGQKFVTGSLFRHVTVMSLTTSVGLVAVFLVDFIDMVFISMLGKEELAAAVGYAGAILFFTTSFSIGLAIAVGALVARAVGAGDLELARSKATHGLVYGVLFGSLFAGLVWFNISYFVSLLGASGATAELAAHYLRIIIPSLPLLVVGMIGGGILRAHGDAKNAMLATILGGAVNAILDPILIFGFDLELTGAAMASLAARVTIGAVALWPILKHHGGFSKIELPAFRGDFRPMAAIALPAILTQLATPAGQAIVTRAIAVFGTDAVSGMAMVGRLMPVSFAVIFALSGAVGPIIGQNFGAGNKARVHATLRAALVFAAIVTVLIASILFVLRPFIATLLNASGLAQELIYLFCGPLALLFFFNGALFCSNAAFNNLGRPFYSTWMNWGRNTVAMVPLVWLGAKFFGAAGVLIGQALSGVVFGSLAVWLAYKAIENPVSEKPSPNSGRGSFERQGRLHSLLNLRR